jgi:uncharacterized delta-60 repeat protein
MKKVTSTLTTLLLCLYVSAQVGSLETSTFNHSNGFVINNLSATQDDYGNSMAVQPADGKIVVAVVTTQNVFKIVRYMPDGTLDPNFATSGIYSKNLTGISDECQSYAVGIQSSGKIVVGGYTWTNSNKDFVLARFNTDGTLDGTFGSAGTPGIVITPVSTITTNAGVDIIRSLVIQPDNTIIAAGYAWNGTDNDFVVAKYSADGVLDGTFGTGGYTITNVNGADMVNAVAVNNTTGSIYVAGTSNVGGTTGDATIACYTSGGALNSSFNTTGILTLGLSGNDEAYGVAVQSDNNVLFTGKKSAPLNTTDLFIARYKPDGTPDTNFGGTGLVTTNFGPGATNSNDEGWGIAIQGDGAIIVAGTTDGNGTYDFLLARYSSNGNPDVSFGPSATGMSAPVLSAQADGGNAVKLYGSHIYVTGSANYTASGTKNFALAAFNNDFNTLPLVLSQFYAQKQTSKVVLQWQTTSEEGVKQFVIERSNDGKTYTAIGQVAAAGTSSLTHNYTFADPSPFQSSNNYYRLLMQDVDGNAKYSKILIVKFDGLISTNMLVYPSPAKDVLQIQLPEGMKGAISLQIFDMNGRLLKINNLASDGNALNTTMDVSTLLKGVYILKAQVGSTSVTSRFTKN